MKTYTTLQVIDMLDEITNTINTKFTESISKPLTIAEHSYRNGLLDASLAITKMMLKITNE